MLSECVNDQFYFFDNFVSSVDGLIVVLGNGYNNYENLS